MLDHEEAHHVAKKLLSKFDTEVNLFSLTNNVWEGDDLEAEIKLKRYLFISMNKFTKDDAFKYFEVSERFCKRPLSKQEVRLCCLSLHDFPSDVIIGQFDLLTGLLAFVDTLFISEENLLIYARLAIGDDFVSTQDAMTFIADGIRISSIRPRAIFCLCHDNERLLVQTSDHQTQEFDLRDEIMSQVFHNNEEQDEDQEDMKSFNLSIFAGAFIAALSVQEQQLRRKAVIAGLPGAGARKMCCSPRGLRTCISVAISAERIRRDRETTSTLSNVRVSDMEAQAKDDVLGRLLLQNAHTFEDEKYAPKDFLAATKLA